MNGKDPMQLREQLQEDLLTQLEELDDEMKVAMCQIICETFKKFDEGG